MTNTTKCSNCSKTMFVNYDDTIPIIRTCDECKGMDYHYQKVIDSIRSWDWDVPIHKINRIMR